MAERISRSRLDDDDYDFIQEKLSVEECYDVTKRSIYLPLAFARITFEIDRQPRLKTNPIFSGQLTTRQTEIADYCVSRLVQDGYAVIRARPGFGKTVTAIAIVSRIKLVTVIITNKVMVLNQWEEAVVKFTDAIIQFVKPGDDIRTDVDVYIVNAVNVTKWPRSAWSRVGMVVVDELHMVVTPVYCKSLLHFTPDCILGLSATPYRMDEYNDAIEWFFGTNFVGDDLYVRHDVHIISTGWYPAVIRYTRKGVDWNVILNEQAANAARNALIVDSCMKHPNKNWLVLVKRRVHAETLKSLFDDRSVSCDTILGSATTFDKSCKVLIGTCSKVGVGFNHPAINALCIAADVKNYFVQFLGRCMRGNTNNRPIVIDFRDSYGPLQRHLTTRIEEYKKHGGIIMA